MEQAQTVEQNAPVKKYELTDETTKSWDGRTLHRIRASSWQACEQEAA